MTDLSDPRLFIGMAEAGPNTGQYLWCYAHDRGDRMPFLETHWIVPTWDDCSCQVADCEHLRDVRRFILRQITDHPEFEGPGQ